MQSALVMWGKGFPPSLTKERWGAGGGSGGSGGGDSTPLPLRGHGPCLQGIR